ncbi:inactive dipeptidyl peptidase 10-like [Coregonus clupeaformis]|uniref:inactive dipeptidyl peptidase 10-like n=1 Tax=Coregonus clupeaformis TaxID=59861 RepID=UPI001E1C7529|nr:inactive dipeptidyl peptidase 10-like [Coregonus clupeaformis]
MIASTQQNMPSDMNGVVYHGPPRNWRGIGIALMVILMIISLVILSVIMLTPDESLLFQRSRLTLEDLDKDDFKVHDPHVTWLNDDEVAFRTRQGHILKHSLSENLTISLLDGSILNLKDTKFQVSPDQKYILLAYNLHLAGDNIRAVTLYVVNVFSPAHTLRMTAPVSLKNRGHYISMVKWTSGTRLAVRWLNRVQNQSVLSVCEATTGVYSQKRKMTMDVWLGQPQEAPLFSRDGSVLYITLLAAQGGHGEYRHVAVLPAQPLTSPMSPRFLTSGHWDVMSLCGLDEDTEKIYFVSTEASKHSRHLYSVNLGGLSQRHCLTCTLSETCRFYKPQFNPSLTRFILHCLGPGIPRVTVHNTREHFNMHLKLGLPQGYEEGLHPLLIILDGAPDTQAVTDRFSLGWPQVLSSIHSVALAWVDGRSGAAHSLRSPDLDPRKLSSQRVKDQLSVVEWLLELPYIDNRRIALYGKAFGGLLTLKMMAAANIFKCAAVMAPITDFKIYNAAFSERYLGLPATEESFYRAASLLDDVVNLKDKNFLLLHGTADAHVHFQHTAELIDHLVAAKANYSLQVYPDEGHILRWSHSDQHFRRTLRNVLLDCLAPMPPRKSDRQEHN